MKNPLSNLLLLLLLLGGLTTEPAVASGDWLVNDAGECRLDSKSGSDGDKSVPVMPVPALPTTPDAAGADAGIAFRVRESLRATPERTFGRTWYKTGPPESPFRFV